MSVFQLIKEEEEGDRKELMTYIRKHEVRDAHNV